AQKKCSEVKTALAGLLLSVGMGSYAFAVPAETEAPAHTAKIPVTVTFNNVQAGDVPFYVSIQTEATYRSMRGYGGVIEATPNGTFTQTFEVPDSGDYAISIWHDLDNDARFSMTDDYQVLDGWATSGTVPLGTMPSFDDAKVTVSGYGANVEVDMIYPTS
ncbi:MAG: DUF2141 domain-containing protein, partial [Pseudomonadota bacterium]